MYSAFLAANGIGYDKSNAVNWPPDDGTNMLLHILGESANIYIINAFLSEHCIEFCIMYMQSISSEFTVVAAKTLYSAQLVSVLVLLVQV